MRRRALRLRDFDYSSSGYYFVTACSRDRACVLGDVENDVVSLSREGVIARECLVAIPEHHSCAAVDSFVVMPNHVHAVLVLAESTRTRLGVIVSTYKAAVSRACRRQSLWQRGYYEHVVRDESDLARIREYIAENPIKWSVDPENPARSS